jgi:uncharacterized repeat protein (TIGR03803 family)
VRTFAQSALTISLAAALLVGCGGSQPMIGTPEAMPQNHTASSSYQVLYGFTGKPDGADPIASLVDVKGVLYGTTIHGGKPRGSTSGPGTVFSITTTGAEHVLHSFDPFVSGKTPRSNLIGVGGILYGTTFVGGKYGGGTVFSLTTTGALHVLHSFGASSNADGANPTAGLVNVSGTLYGTTLYGGTYDSGTVFSMTKGGTEQVLHSFGNGLDGKQPEAALVHVEGTLYGTTSSGGTYDLGTVFSVTPGGAETVLHSFGSGNDGKNPQAGLVELNGKLYGTTTYGGAQSGRGTVFSITPGGKEKVLHTFGKGADGVNPYAGLIDVGGTLYGTTFYGGTASYAGTVFSITPTGTEEVLHSFGSGIDGSNPSATLTDVNGTLYGTTEAGGSYGYGTVFALTP